MGRGCSSQRVCSTLLFSLLPAITALFSSSPPAQPAAHVQAPGIFYFLILRHLFPSFPLPCNLSPPLPLALLSVLHHGLPPVNVSIVVGCHAALRSPPFWLNGHRRRNFSRAQRDSPDSLLTIVFLPCPLSLFSLSLSPSSSLLSALGQPALTGR